MCIVRFSFIVDNVGAVVREMVLAKDRYGSMMRGFEI